MDPSAEVPSLDPTIAAYMTPDLHVLANAKKALSDFKTAFPLTKREEKKSTKRHWRDYLEGNSVALDESLNALKKQKEDEERSGQVTELKLDAMTARLVDKVGAIDPVADFNAMLKRRDSAEWVGKAITEMFAMIKTIVVNSFGTSTYPKAVECLQACRIGCVQ